MTPEEKNKIEYTVALISDFGKKYNLSPKQAFNYLYRFNGIEFLEKHYNVMHTQSFEDSIEDLAFVCRKQGGLL